MLADNKVRDIPSRGSSSEPAACAGPSRTPVPHSSLDRASPAYFGAPAIRVTGLTSAAILLAPKGRRSA